MINLIKPYKTISIIGMAKNVGKTTTLNYLLKKLYRNSKIGLTSIGMDGEIIDTVTSTEKPRIYVESGTIIATCSSCLNNCDFTKQVLETTNINTPLGEVIIVKALSDGYALVAGPTYNKQIKKIIDIFFKYDVDKILIDGAVNRMSSADSYISEATILCTGASYSSQIGTVIDDTLHFVDMLTLNVVDENIKKLVRRLISVSQVSLIYNDFSFKKLTLKTALNSAKTIISEIDANVRYLVLNGALTTELISELVQNRHKIKQLTIIVNHGTKCIFDLKASEKLKRCKINIEVLSKTNLICLTINPISPYGYIFNEQQFLNSLRKKSSVPIYNVMRD